MSAERGAGVVLRRLHLSAGLEQVNCCLSTPSKGGRERGKSSEKLEGRQRNGKGDGDGKKDKNYMPSNIDRRK